jgi:hypothetical protein
MPNSRTIEKKARKELLRNLSSSFSANCPSTSLAPDIGRSIVSVSRLLPRAPAAEVVGRMLSDVISLLLWLWEERYQRGKTHGHAG